MLKTNLGRLGFTVVASGWRCRRTVCSGGHVVQPVTTWLNRGYATAAPSSGKSDDLRSKATNEESVKGTEGLHFRDATTVISPSDNVHTGDWVLFHPVYTPEELKSVQVN